MEFQNQNLNLFELSVEHLTYYYKKGCLNEFRLMVETVTKESIFPPGLVIRMIGKKIIFHFVSIEPILKIVPYGSPTENIQFLGCLLRDHIRVMLVQECLQFAIMHFDFTINLDIFHVSLYGTMSF